MKIYTKTGDDGTTSLIGGKRVSKAEKQVEAYGQLDELNSSIGYFYALYGHDVLSEEYKKLCLQIQRDLFKIGTLLSYDFKSKQPFTYGFIEAKDVEKLEKEIDTIQAALPPLRGFILPGGCAAAACVHQLRCVCRRVERHVTAFYMELKPKADAESFVLALRYINRLSDFFFVMARYLNKAQGTEEKMV